MTQWVRHIRRFLFSTVLFACAVESFAADSTAVKPMVDSSKTIYHERRPNGLGVLYEISQDPTNVSVNMTRSGKKMGVNLKVSNLFGINYQRSLNEWISVFGILAHQRLDIEYVPRDNSDRERSLTANELFLQSGFTVGFPFIRAQNYQLRALGFMGITVGYAFLSDDYYKNTAIFGYTRGIGIQANIYRFAILAGFRSNHSYFHTYKDGHDDDKDESFMLDFDTMANPFFSIGVGF